MSFTRHDSCHGRFGWCHGATAVVLFLAGVIPAMAQDANTSGESVKTVISQNLPNVPGKTLTVVIVTYAPGAKSAPHHHAGFVFAYVLKGEIRSQVSGGSVTIYHAGEHFIEPPGAQHLVSENASATQPAQLMAVFVADQGAALTMPLR